MYIRGKAITFILIFHYAVRKSYFITITLLLFQALLFYKFKNVLWGTPFSFPVCFGGRPLVFQFLINFRVGCFGGRVEITRFFFSLRSKVTVFTVITLLSFQALLFYKFKKILLFFLNREICQYVQTNNAGFVSFNRWLISLPILSASPFGTFIGYQNPNNYEKEVNLSLAA